jgi:hypothetical protein
MKKVIVLIIVIVIVKTSFCQVKTYSSATLCNNLVTIKVGDLLSIQTPNQAQSGYDLFRFQYIYSNIWDIPPYRRTNMGGSGNFNAIVEKIYNRNNSREVMAIAADEYTGTQFYISLQGALSVGEIVTQQNCFFSRYKAFLSYLETINNIDETTEVSYLKNFRKKVRNQSEFDRRRDLNMAKSICDDLKINPNPRKNYIAFYSATFEEYDFDKKGFLLKNMVNQQEYDLETGKEMRKSILNYDNIPSEYFLPIDEKNAEAITTFYKKNNLPRKLYYKYDFDLEGYRVKGLDLRKSLGEPDYLQNVFIEDAIVNKILFYIDVYSDNPFHIVYPTSSRNDSATPNDNQNSLSKTAENESVDSGYNYIVNDTAFFYDEARESARNNNYLLKDKIIHGSKELDGFVYVEGQNNEGAKETGWLMRKNLSIRASNTVINPSAVISNPNFNTKVSSTINNNDVEFNIKKTDDGYYRLKTKSLNDEIKFNSTLRNVEFFSYVISKNFLKVKDELGFMGAKFTDKYNADWVKIPCCRILIEQIEDTKTRVSYYIACGD